MENDIFEDIGYDKGDIWDYQEDMALKRCKKCGIPLEGFLYKWVTSKLFEIKPSEKDPDVCNNCERGPEDPALEDKND